MCKLMGNAHTDLVRNKFFVTRTLIRFGTEFSLRFRSYPKGNSQKDSFSPMLLVLKLDAYAASKRPAHPVDACLASVSEFRAGVRRNA